MQEAEDIIDVICKAIKQGRFVKFYYESDSSQKKEWRTVIPYIVGIKDRGNGNLFLAALPIAELSKPLITRQPGHYLIKKIDINRFEVLQEIFENSSVPKNLVLDTPTIQVICRFKCADEQ